MADADNTCFVIMPFGTKQDADGKDINFDKIYDFIIEAAVDEVDGLSCVRCDKIEESGSIHREMLTHIYEDRVALVDMSTLNANVFYELGVRHALKRGVTVLIQREGTPPPFNISGMKTIMYSTELDGPDHAKKAIRAFIEHGLQKPDHVDSLVFDALPELSVQRAPRKRVRLTKTETIAFALVKRPECAVGFVTGDREYVKVGDIWVNSENTDMQMDRYYGQSTSATIRYLGAKKDDYGEVEEDTIADELARRLGTTKTVKPTRVVPTVPGELAANGVKWIFHVASVIGEPRMGYQPIKEIERCVTSAFAFAASSKFAATPEFQADLPTSILFPIFGTGAGGGDLGENTRLCVDKAVHALEENMAPSVTHAWFAVWDDMTMEACLEAVAQNDGLQQPAAADGG